MTVTVVYIDILLALNLFIDFLLLCGTARVLRLPTSRGRLIAGAVVGALSSLIILLPPLEAWVTALYKLGCAMLMVPIAFKLHSWIHFFRITAVLFVISAVFAGVCSGIWMMATPAGIVVQSGVVYMDVPPLLLLVLTTVSYGVLWMYDRVTARRMVRGGAFRVELREQNERVILRALFDSGHSLCDSFSGAPVIVADRKALGTLAACTQPVSASAAPIRYIPFSCIGSDGVLPSFRPTYAVLYADGKEIDISGAWVAVCDRLGKGDYEALIGPALADQITDAAISKRRETL